ncbi:hypothetical protein [Nostoc favosum]|uniref:Uncharacterized protein n=1 Tax=Nostoc favosum CHAB5714 TaxID=2780399 RepID=A0ABS8IFB6_9NOSO|nr:hypothetical protein [Nostoc favosum]MCC5602576.1 hypothetical protein [Nostoc favosum CHAB5714]
MDSSVSNCTCFPDDGHLTDDKFFQPLWLNSLVLGTGWKVMSTMGYI